MEDKNKEFLELLTKTANSIKNIENITSEEEKIKKSIDKIQTEIKNIKSALRKSDKIIKEESENINLYKSEINNIKFELLEKDTDKIKSILQANLPNNIEYTEYENGIKLYDKVKSVQKKISDNVYVGYIEIEELESNQNKVNIVIKDETTESEIIESFIVEDPLRIYNIIVHLNMKLNYETTY